MSYSLPPLLISGERGLKGFRGEKGDGAAVIPQELTEKINEVDQLLLSLQTVTTTLQELREKVNNLGKLLR